MELCASTAAALSRLGLPESGSEAACDLFSSVTELPSWDPHAVASVAWTAQQQAAVKALFAADVVKRGAAKVEVQKALVLVAKQSEDVAGRATLPAPEDVKAWKVRRAPRRARARARVARGGRSLGRGARPSPGAPSGVVAAGPRMAPRASARRVLRVGRAAGSSARRSVPARIRAPGRLACQP